MHTIIYIIFHVNTVVSNKDAFSCRLMYLFLQLHWIQISYYVSIKRKIHSYIRTKTIYCSFYRIFHKQAEKKQNDRRLSNSSGIILFWVCRNLQVNYNVFWI